jgi:hypothetical protein
MEDLNIYNMKVRIITKCWLDKRRYPSIGDIASVTGLRDRTIHRIAMDNDLPKRNKANIDAYLLNSHLKLKR